MQQNSNIKAKFLEIESGATVTSWELRFIPLIQRILLYLEALKPRETFLLLLIGTLAAIAASNGKLNFSRLFLVSVALALGCAGCNGLTNYLDREWDAKMERTKKRPLPSGRISPAEKVLPLVAICILTGLAITWYLYKPAFWIAIGGVISAAVARKTFVTHYLGIISGITPVAIGWLTIAQQINSTFILLLLLIGIWVPIHVWSLMLSYREDYLKAGLFIFPITNPVKVSVKLIFVLSLLLTIVSTTLYLTAKLAAIFLGGITLLNILLLYGSWQLMFQQDKEASWRLYKLCTYPYLGLTFALLSLGLWL